MRIPVLIFFLSPHLIKRNTLSSPFQRVVFAISTRCVCDFNVLTPPSKHAKRLLSFPDSDEIVPSLVDPVCLLGLESNQIPTSFHISES